MRVMLGTEDWAVTVLGCEDGHALGAWLESCGVERGNVFPTAGDVILVIEAESPDAALSEARRMLADAPVRFDNLEVQ